MGINLDEALPDFSFIESLSGIKIISKGNHDYWWSTRRKFQSFLDANGLKPSACSITILTGSEDIPFADQGWIDQGIQVSMMGIGIFSRDGRLRLSLERESGRAGS